MRRKAKHLMKIFIQAGVLFGLFWVAQCIVSVLPLPFPAGVAGLILLLTLLLTGVLKRKRIQEVSDFMLNNLQFFFIPGMVGIVQYTGLLKAHGVAILVICVVSLMLTFGVTAWAVTLTMRLMERRKRK